MKTSRITTDRQNKQDFNAKPRPEIRDDLDSRSHIEGNFREEKSKNGDRQKSDK